MRWRTWPSSRHCPCDRSGPGWPGRRVRVSFGALWRLVHAEGLFVPVKTVLATAPARDDTSTGSPPRGLCVSRILGEDKHGPAAQPVPRRRTKTLVAAPMVDRIDAPCVFAGTINASLKCVWINGAQGSLHRACFEQVLTPALPKTIRTSGRRGPTCSCGAPESGPSGAFLTPPTPAAAT
jgi:hypothetical protein